MVQVIGGWKLGLLITFNVALRKKYPKKNPITALWPPCLSGNPLLAVKIAHVQKSDIVLAKKPCVPYTFQMMLKSQQISIITKTVNNHGSFTRM